jgi:hypothetical protein
MSSADTENPSLPQASVEDDPVIHRPLTPLNKCLKVGLPAACIRTAAGFLDHTTPQEFNNNMGAAALIHAKVYSFAHRFFVSELATFALQRLTQVLILVKGTEIGLFPHLADAIRLIYSTTPSLDVEEDPARKFLSQFVALRYISLIGEDLNTLMAEGGEFTIDVSHKLSFGTSSLKEQIDELREQMGRLEDECKEIRKR